MRLSRPVALGLMALCALVVLWLVAQSLPGDQGSQGSTPSVPTGAATASVAAPGGGAGDDGDDDDDDDGDGDGPTGTDTRDWDGIDACDDDVLPSGLGEVVDDIEAGGPFDHPGKDGSAFGNHEGYLPDESRGYYREYTVQTPGLDHRGARRVVTGGEAGGLPEVWYYTDDHYVSFCEFVH